MLHSVQSLLAERSDGEWQIALYQNTPAAYHGRPERGRALTEELVPLTATLGQASTS
ncbi:MAG: hypothetical protein ACM30G_12065 [Micromonosporaceae bacterium]